MEYLPSAPLSQTWTLDFLLQRVLQLHRPWRADLRWAEVRLAPGQTGRSGFLCFGGVHQLMTSASQVWMYCRLYRTVERFHKPEILEAAKAGMLFMELGGKNWGLLEFTVNFSWIIHLQVLTFRDGFPLTEVEGSLFCPNNIYFVLKICL